ncbi:hypothetical protein Zm00014a_042891 [Zea mays]|uniref:Uncharacterized protein n=2 Tax=Zea mays TaxID=4577 RepID=A0A1D6H071_MAIZE|nr:uncharacterized protein LOC103626601 [Zea mays]AQK68341.1 hypothetical protein ZEAMMB73_Zm00001d015215 [Zea mays]PWZ20241.1 hypothetical protein Zm00014a_042891 [Zea mays]|eukprot:XP_008645232.1 uncharacterized protein LOC103626601 [Zea mays]
MRPPPKPASGGGATQLASRPTSNRPGGGVLRLRLRLLQAPAVVALAAALAVSSAATPPPAPAPAPLCNLPPTLSGSDGGGRQGEANRIRHPKSERAARCTSKCVSTCVLGGYGAPGVAGPFNIRRPLVVFKDTFRSRQYCLVECSDICNLLKDGEDDQ